ncbi:MAG: NUDIX hydrolase [Terracidiphilus sp.]
MNPAQNSLGRSIATLSSREVYRNRWMRLREDEILRSNGEKGIYGVVEKEDSAIILPIDRGRIWLVEQYRYTIEERALELPQGSWEMESAHPEELARGELREELGLDAAEMIHLGSLWIAYGFTRQKQHIFLATSLTPTQKDPDAEEHDLTGRSVPVEEFECSMAPSATAAPSPPGGSTCCGRRAKVRNVRRIVVPREPTRLSQFDSSNQPLSVDSRN